MLQTKTCETNICNIKVQPKGKTTVTSVVALNILNQRRGGNVVTTEEELKQKIQ